MAATKGARWRKLLLGLLLGSGLLVVGVVVVALLSSNTSCDEARARWLSESYDVRFTCHGAECRASISAKDARGSMSAMMPVDADARAVAHCGDVSSKPDAKYSTAASGDPCCTAGGSACTHFYYYFISESAGQLCIAL